VAVAVRGSTPTIGTATTGATISAVLTGTKQPQAGDLLVIIHCNDYWALSNMPTPTVGGSTTGVNAITGGSADAGSPNPHAKSYWYAVPSTADRTVAVTETGTADEEKALIVYVLSGADTITAIDVAAGSTGAASTSHVAPSIAPGSATAYLIGHASTDGTAANTNSYTPPSGMSETYDQNIISFMALTGATQQLAASGATGTKTFAYTASTVWVTLSIAVLTASGGGGSAPVGRQLVVTAPTDRPRSVGMVVRRSLADPPVLTTASPLVVDPAPPAPTRAAAVLLRSSLQDTVAPAVAPPGPLVVGRPQAPAPLSMPVLLRTPATPVPPSAPYVVAQPAAAAPSLPVLLRGALVDAPVLMTSSPTVVTTAPAQPAAAAIVSRAPQPVVIAAASTPAPIVVTTAVTPSVPDALLIRNTLADATVPATPEPLVVTAPTPPPASAAIQVRNPQPPVAVVSGTTPQPIVVTQSGPPSGSAALTLRAHLQDAILATPGPLVVTTAVPAQPSRPIVARGSLADLLAATRPLIVGAPVPAARGTALTVRNAPPPVVVGPSGPITAPIVVTVAGQPVRGSAMVLRTGSGVCDCTTHRPSSGVTVRPSGGTTVRPSVGTTTYAPGGTTTRPNTGTTTRPCSCS
jgi:hypothetical protein